MNNYERIKNMTLDEMAEWLSNLCKTFSFSDDVYMSEKYIEFRLSEYQKVFKQWLQQESEG